MRRKRKTRYTWFPVLGTQFGAEEVPMAPFFNRTDPISNNRNDAVSNTVVQALVPDFTPEDTAVDAVANSFESSLRDRVEGQDWLLKRLVGKCFVFVENSQENTGTVGWPYVLCTAGFFVARADDDNQGVCDLTTDEIAPQGIKNIMNPWIWRRSWLLANPAWDGANSAGRSGWLPPNNASYYSALDGPHIDSKVARRITKEHRLWFTMQATGWDSSGTIEQPNGSQQPSVAYTLDLRVLGAMRRGKNSSSF